MPKAGIPDALLVNLVVEDEPGLKELKFARRCAEARQLFRDVLQPQNAGPLATNSPTIGVKGHDDVSAVLAFAKTQAGRRLIHSVAPMPLGVPFVEEVKPKKPKVPDDAAVFAVEATDDDDEAPINALLEIDD